MFVRTGPALRSVQAVENVLRLFADVSGFHESVTLCPPADVDEASFSRVIPWGRSEVLVRKKLVRGDSLPEIVMQLHPLYARPRNSGYSRSKRATQTWRRTAKW